MTDFDPDEFVRSQPNLKILLDLRKENDEITVYFNPDDGRYYARGYWTASSGAIPRVKLLPCKNEEEIGNWIGNARHGFYTS